MPEKVLAIASHVVYGYVGNKIATFVLQSHGLDVSPLNTVQFSNHTGYHTWTGDRATAQQISALWDGLKTCGGAEEHELLLTGYIPGAEGVTAVGRIADELRHLRKHHGGVFWVLDPVMGDSGKLYVAEAVVPVYKSLLPLADCITPNQFEAELLSGVTITDLSSLSLCLATLRKMYAVSIIIISSVVLPSEPDNLICAASSARSAECFYIRFKSLPGAFVGTGDMFAALVMAHGYNSLSKEGDGRPKPLERVVRQVLGEMRVVLERTARARDVVLERISGSNEELDDKARTIQTMRASELRLVGYGSVGEERQKGVEMAEEYIAEAFPSEEVKKSTDGAPPLSANGVAN